MPSPLQAGASFADVLARIVRPEKFVPWARRTYSPGTFPSDEVVPAGVLSEGAAPGYQGELFDSGKGYTAPLQALREARLRKPGGRPRVFLGNIPSTYYRPDAPLRSLALRSSPDVGEDWFNWAEGQRFMAPHFDLSGGAQALARLLHNREYPNMADDLMPSMFVSGVPRPKRPLLVTDTEANRATSNVWKQLGISSRREPSWEERFDRLRGLGYDALLYPNKYEGAPAARKVPWVPQDPERGYPFKPLTRTPIELREELARRYFAGDTSVIPNPAMVLLDSRALADVAEHRRAGGAV